MQGPLCVQYDRRLAQAGVGAVPRARLHQVTFLGKLSGRAPGGVRLVVAWRTGERDLKTEMRRDSTNLTGSEMANGEDSMALATIQHAVNHAVAHRNEDGAVGADAEGTSRSAQRSAFTNHFATPACPFL